MMHSIPRPFMSSRKLQRGAGDEYEGFGGDAPRLHGPDSDTGCSEVSKCSYRVQSTTRASFPADIQTERVNRLRAITLSCLCLMSLPARAADAGYNRSRLAQRLGRRCVEHPGRPATVCLTGTTLCVVADQRGTFRLPNIRSGDYALSPEPDRPKQRRRLYLEQTHEISRSQ